MSFGGLIQTFHGRNELAKAELGEQFQFTEIWLGDGSFSGSFLAKEKLEHAVMQLPISSIKRKEETVILESEFHSKSAPQAFYFREIGIFANGKLCFYDNSGTDAEYIDPDASQIVKQKRLRFVLSISSSIEVTVNLAEGLYALEEDLVQHAKDGQVHVTTEEKTKWNEGIGEKTVTFTQADKRENLTSGEKLKTSLGKIKKWFADLKTVAFTGNYSDLSNKPTIPAAVRVKGNAESAYRTGNVNLTPENIGALPASGGTLTGDLRIKGSENYGTKINLGDGDYVHFSEPTDDCLEVKAKKINFLVSNTTDEKFTLNGEKIGAEADKLTTARTIDGVTFDGSANISHFAVCETAGDVAEKVVSIPNFNIVNGARITVDFKYKNTTSSPNLKVNDDIARSMVYSGSNGYQVVSDIARGNYDFIYYDGHWNMLNDSMNGLIVAGSIDTTDANATTWTSVDTLTTGMNIQALFYRISAMFKNVRYLYKRLGTTSISSLGDGTITGAINTLNTNLSNWEPLIISEPYSGFSYTGGVMKYHPILKLAFISVTIRATVATTTGVKIDMCKFNKVPSVNTALSARTPNTAGQAVNVAIFTDGTLSLSTDKAIPKDGYILCSGIYSFT